MHTQLGHIRGYIMPSALGGLSTRVMELLRLSLAFVFLVCGVRGALQKSHEKPQAVKWMESFLGRAIFYDQVPSLVNLVNVVTNIHLSNCMPIILYDVVVEQSEGMLLEQLFRNYPVAYVHGQITSNYTIKVDKVLKTKENTCIAYVMFMKDVMRCKDIIGPQTSNKVIIVARSSQWRVYEFLGSEEARYFVNLLVIAQSEKVLDANEEIPYILYTHKMFMDSLGTSIPIVLTSWKGNKFTRIVNLFPSKMSEGFAGHRFVISIAHQPPFTVKREVDQNGDPQWDGIEVRLLNLLSKIYNFTTDFREAKEVGQLGSGDSIVLDVHENIADLGVGGIYVTIDRFLKVDIAQSHSQDCAAFITLTSTALPKYRAIMGPFHWSVWLAVTAAYLFAIFPLALSDKHTLKHLIKDPQEIENMFWYVFGTFTNCFTFTGEASWGKSKKVTTRVLVGFYWIFTIITTACYTGSIIAFVTLPVYPETVDTTKQLVSGRFQLGTLNKGGWQYWFKNSSEKYVDKLFKNIEFLPTVDSGLYNVTRAFFWPYAFLGSRAELDFIVRTNFTTQSKRSVLHISNECFVPYGVSLVFTLNSIYKNVISRGVLHAVQGGFLKKLKMDVEWDLMRSATGKLLQANSGSGMKVQVDDRALTLDDTQGMFLLLAIGFLLGGASLLSEWLGGCFNFCKVKVRRLSTSSIDSNPRSHDAPTPREKANSLQYSVHTRLCSIADVETSQADGKEENGVVCHTADLVFHADGARDVDDGDGASDVDDAASTELDEEIADICKLDSIFGESNCDDVDGGIEEITDAECDDTASYD